MADFLPFVTEGNRSAPGPINLADYEPSTWEVVKHALNQAIENNPSPQFENMAAAGGFSEYHDYFDYDMPDVDVVAEAQARLANTPKYMPLDEQEKFIEGYGLTGKISPHEKLKEEDLRILCEGMQKANMHSLVAEKASSWQSVAGFGAGLVGGMLDPIVIGSMFLPVIPEATQAAMLAKSATSGWGRALARAKIGAATGAVGSAILEPIVFSGMTTAERDYTMLNSLMNIGAGAIFGAAMHPALGAAGEWLRGKGLIEPRAQSWEYVESTAETERLMRDHASLIYQARMDANPALDAATIRNEANDAAFVFDQYIRNRAYHNQIRAEVLYKRFEMDWMSGKIYDRYALDAERLGREFTSLRDEIAQVEARRAMIEAGDDSLRYADDGFDLQAAIDRFEVVSEEYRKARRVLAAENDTGKLSEANRQELDAIKVQIENLEKEINLNQKIDAAGLKDYATRKKKIAELDELKKQREKIRGKKKKAELDKQIADLDDLLKIAVKPANWEKIVRPKLEKMREKLAILEQREQMYSSLYQTREPQSGMMPPDILGSTFTDAKGRSVLRLFEKHNTSTVIHEMGHAVRRQLEIMAKQPVTSPKIREQWAALEQHFGIEPNGVWTREQEEAFSRAFEKFFLTGAVPRPEMAGVFEAIKSRMIDIYTNADALGSPISEPVRKMFNNLFTVPVYEGYNQFRRALAEVNTERWENSFTDLQGKGNLERLYQDAGLDAGRIDNASAKELAEMKTQLESLDREAEDSFRYIFEKDTALDPETKKQIASEYEDAMREFQAESEEIAKRTKLVEEYFACIL